MRVPAAFRPGARLRRAIADRRGVSALEFAIIAGPLFLLMVSGMELARYSATVNSLRGVVGDMARAATLRGGANLTANRAACTNITPANLTAGVSTGLVDPSRLTVTVDSCVTNGAATTVTLTARYQHSFLFALLSPYSGTVTETATAIFN